MPDSGLKSALADLLPAYVLRSGCQRCFYWLTGSLVLDTEWLYLVHCAEKQLSTKPVAPEEKSEATLYREALCVETVMEGGPITASWQQRMRALLKVRARKKG